MTNKEIKELIENAYEELKDNHRYVGLRFEDKEREIGEICENSKHNPDREDPRDYPEYGTEEYENLPEFNGTSAWDLDISDMHRTWFDSNYMDDNEKSYYPDEYEHCYIIVGNAVNNHHDRDYDEIIIKNAEVKKIIW